MKFTDEGREVNRSLRGLYTSKAVVLYGSDQPRAYELRLRIRNRLRQYGFTRTSTVRELPKMIEGKPVDAAKKSYYWVEHADFNIFIFQVGHDNSGVTLEVKHALNCGPAVMGRSLCAEEYLPSFMDTEGVVTELLRAEPGWARLERAKWIRGDEDALFDRICRFLEDRIWYG